MTPPLAINSTMCGTVLLQYSSFDYGSGRSPRTYTQTSSACYSYIPPLASKGLSGTALYGVIAGAVAFLIISLIAIVLIIRRRRQRNAPPAPIPIKMKRDTEQFEEASYEDVPEGQHRKARNQSEDTYTDANDQRKSNGSFEGNYGGAMLDYEDPTTTSGGKSKYILH